MWNRCRELAGVFGRVAVASGLLVSAIYAGAATEDQCMRLYGKSLGIPGTSICEIQVAGTMPMSDGPEDPYNPMNYYNCGAWIKDYCRGDTGGSSPDTTCPIDDPVFAASGIVTTSENDFVSGDEIPFAFARTYRSAPYPLNTNALGPAWVHNWQRKLAIVGTSDNPTKINAYRANGEPIAFSFINGAWRTTAFSGLTLARIGTDWSLADLVTENVETYSAQGVLLSESTKTGFVRTPTYDDAGRLAAITQHGPGTRPAYDLTLRLEYDPSGHVARLIDPAGGVTQYKYDYWGNLISLTWPDGNVRQYVYSDAQSKRAMTGIIDETGSRIATWTYDLQGRATAVSHPDTTRNVRFGYEPGTTTITDGNGAKTLSFSTIAGQTRPVSSSGTTAGSWTWNTAGELLGLTTPGRNATYAYDEADRPIKATVLTRSGLSVTSVQYADSTSLHPAAIALPGKLASFVYDSKGNVTGYSERVTNDTTGEAGFNATWNGQLQRTVGARYDAFNRLVEAITYVNNVKTADWIYFYDYTGNLSIAQNIVSRWIFSNQDRDAAHRVTQQTGDYRDARIAYDSRGRVTRFTYDEQAIASIGRSRRLLTVDYAYSANGTLASRRATVAKDGGAVTAISREEADRWLDNYEAGIDPVGPLTGLLARVISPSDSALNIAAVCPECGFIQARPAWPLFIQGLYVDARTGEPVTDNPVEIQVAAQNQLPFPVLTPSLSQRSMLYTQLFASKAIESSGFIKCKDTENCSQVRTLCRERCDAVLPTGTDVGFRYWTCVNDCAELHGCPRI